MVRDRPATSVELGWDASDISPKTTYAPSQRHPVLCGNPLRRLRIRILEQNVDSGEWRGWGEWRGVYSGEAGWSWCWRRNTGVRRTAALCVDDELRYDKMRNSCLFCFNLFKKKKKKKKVRYSRSWPEEILATRLSRVWRLQASQHCFCFLLVSEDRVATFLLFFYWN